ncbi:MAG: hypothetical protein PW788_12450 [Micavibrio sp.]|nr:hypothetical protein [Micavibrio sp.]
MAAAQGGDGSGGTGTGGGGTGGDGSGGTGTGGGGTGGDGSGGTGTGGGGTGGDGSGGTGTGGGGTGGGGTGGGGTGGDGSGGTGSTPLHAPGLTVTINAGVENQPLPVNISLTVDTTAGVVTVIQVTGLPPGTTFSAGTSDGNGGWTLTPSELAGLTITFATNWSGNGTLTFECDLHARRPDGLYHRQFEH